MAYMNLAGNIEETLVNLANEHKLKKSKEFKIKKYQRIDAWYYDQSVLKRILKEFKFKDAGNIYDYDEFENFEPIKGNGVLDYSLFNKIGISKKYNSLVYYNKDNWSIDCMFLISTKKLKKFTEITSKIAMENDGSNDLKGYDFTCEAKMYLEISDSVKDETKRYEIQKKHIQDENLVFDENSTITKVKKLINNFFTDKTKNIYKKLDAPFKRGIILHGEPGNGKSAMIREIIREIDKDVIKIIVKRVRNLADVLAALTSALNGKRCIVILEDMDSMIREEQRSEVLNILDGVDVSSGMFLIGTTNYLERLDSGLVNRAGRFDKVYKIENPNDNTRKLFFESKKLDELFSDFEYSKYSVFQKENYTNELINSFVDNSRNLPMASLKELVTTVAYKLAYGEKEYIQDALIEAYTEIIESRNEHSNMRAMCKHGFKRNDEDDDYPVKMAPIQFESNMTMMPIGETVQVQNSIEEIQIEEEPKIRHVKVRRIK